MTCVQRFLISLRVRLTLQVFDDNEFFDLHNTLDNRMKDLYKMGKIAPCEKAEPISITEETKL